MPGIFPEILEPSSPTAGSIMCMHGGLFVPSSPTTTILIDGLAVCTTKAGFKPVSATPCNAPALSSGAIPLCIFATPAKSMAVTSKMNGFAPVVPPTPQLPANAQPTFIAITVSSTSKVL